MASVHLTVPGPLGGLLSPTLSADQDGVWLLVPARARLPEPPDTSPASSQPVPQATAENARSAPWRFHRSGTIREIIVHGCRSTLRDRLGHRYIDALLQRPYQAIPAIEIAAAEHGRDVRMFAGSCGEVMSAASLDDLKKRALELRGDLEEARESGHAGHQERILTELGRIADIIRTSTGKGGTTRRQSDAERVRVAVTNAIRRSIWSIDQIAPPVAEYFRQTIRTGYWLQYRPQGDERWST